MKHIIQLDFDGTVVEHAYPRLGRYNPGSLEVVKKLHDAGHEIVLNTMRVELQSGLEFKKTLDFVVDNRRYIKDVISLSYNYKKISPHPWILDELGKKEHIFIDDIAKGIPLIPAVMTRGYMVDWKTIEQQFIEKGVL